MTVDFVKGAVIYRLGFANFRLENCPVSLAQEIDKLLPRRTTPLGDEKLFVVDMSDGANVRDLLNQVLGFHNKCLWIDAACLLAPNGKKVLIAGKSSAGKSTLAMALALGHKWKVLAEDLVLFDKEKNEIISFSSPFSLKAGTAELLRATVNYTANDFVLEEWLPLKDLAFEGTCPAHVDVAILLDERDHTKDVSVAHSDAHRFVRNILPLSNIMHLIDGPEKIQEFLAGAKVMTMQFGSLQQRIDAVCSLIA